MFRPNRVRLFVEHWAYIEHHPTGALAVLLRRISRWLQLDFLLFLLKSVQKRWRKITFTPSDIWMLRTLQLKFSLVIFLLLLQKSTN